ncbi:MAG TPA: spore coat protein U domain-containing protein [Methylotenera sp.]|nr:spore coat protein U domain-containing protein [Methylotenera sp.]
MKLKFIQLIVTTLLFLSCSCTQAAIDCTVTSLGFATAYAPTGVVPNTTQGTMNLSCFRQLATDPTTLNYSIAVDNGIHSTSTQNRAQLNTSNRINYETYSDSGCSTLWASGTANRITGSMSLGGFAATNVTVSYWGCITTANQNVAAGSYTDTVTMTVRNTTLGTSLQNTSTFPVTITNPATCAITSIGSVAFGTYAAFRATALTAPTSNIVLNCTSGLPYSLALDTTSGVVIGLNYSLALSVTSSRGTGPGQTHTITGTMPANQAGTCATGSCSGSDPHTLTITY